MDHLLLTRLIETTGISRVDLAERTEYSVGTLNRFICGSYRPINPIFWGRAIPVFREEARRQIAEAHGEAEEKIRACEALLSELSEIEEWVNAETTDPEPVTA